MNIKLPDGTLKELADNSTALDLAKNISEGLARVTLAAEINSVLCDVSAVLKDGDSVRLITGKDEKGLEVYRHSTAHIMAFAIRRLFPAVQLAIGPTIENGFYYDLDGVSLTNDDFVKIEAEMKKICDAKMPFVRKEIPRSEALNKFKDEFYKTDIISRLEDSQTISFYDIGSEFTDLCRGPHVPDTGFIKAFKIIRLAGAYWRGDSKNKMLVRVYATSFPDKKGLDEYLAKMKEAEDRDHNKLGRELGLFITDPSVGQGLPLLTPKGTTIRKVLIDFVEKEEKKRGYQFTHTPCLAKSDLYKISGHWDHYRDGMFVIHDPSGDFALRPMTCPFHFTLYNAGLHSYRELPMKFAETSLLFRNENSGEMHGLTRVRQFTLADAHIVCTPQQVEEEFKDVMNLIAFVMETLGFKDYRYRFSKWDPANPGGKYVNEPEAWERTQTQMKRILDNLNLSYEEAEGEAAFYGPKLDVQMKNVWGKEDTMFTVQIDFALPDRFKMRYTDAEGKEQMPIVIHRSSIGCYERTMAALIENLAGKFPFWMSPEQVVLMTINEKAQPFAEEIASAMIDLQLRPKVDARNESLKKKVRDAQLSHIPLLVTLGDKEVAERCLSLRTLDGTVRHGVKFDDFIKFVCQLERSRTKTISLEEFVN